VLIIVLWIAFGLVSLALYFAHSMSLELRAADNRVAGTEAEQAIEGAVRYLTNILANVEQPGTLPDTNSYHFVSVPVGDATFWLLGRHDLQSNIDQPAFGLVDEASKLNLNTAPLEMLQSLPRMTPELAAAIIDWRDSDEAVTTGGAESEMYLRRNPAYRCKNAPFESIDELRLVFGATMEILYGEDTNLNGVLDLNENDGDASPPFDNRDGRLDPGLLEYVTVYSREANTRSDGTPRINVNSGQQQLAALLRETFDTQRANQILQQARPIPGGYRSVLQFYARSRMTAEEFAKIESEITVSNGQFIEGLINVNTASEAVLACIPGIGQDYARSLVASRQTRAANTLTSLAWVTELLTDESGIRLAGQYLTGRTYQFTADIAAVGHFGRGYRRVRFVLDTTEEAPKIFYRQDLSHLGWALGRQARNVLLMAKETRR
jgi:type II secretory pathway component PulK